MGLILYNSMLLAAFDSDLIDVVFDNFRNNSIKNSRRDTRITGEEVEINSITAGQKVLR